jgi:hypothetical protein
MFPLPYKTTVKVYSVDFGLLTQPIYVVDCFHIKCTMYGGVIMAISSRTGSGRTVVEADAWLPTRAPPIWIGWFKRVKDMAWGWKMLFSQIRVPF